MNDGSMRPARDLPAWIVGVILFASGLIIGQTLSKIVAKLGLF